VNDGSLQHYRLKRPLTINEKIEFMQPVSNSYNITLVQQKCLNHCYQAVTCSTPAEMVTDDWDEDYLNGLSKHRRYGL